MIWDKKPFKSTKGRVYFFLPLLEGIKNDYLESDFLEPEPKMESLVYEIYEVIALWRNLSGSEGGRTGKEAKMCYS